MSSSDPSFHAPLEEAKRLHQTGAPLRAEPVYRQWLAEHPHDPEVLQLLGLALAQTDRVAEALPLWREAASRSPQRADLWNNLGEACRRAGQLPEARQHLARAVALAPQFAEAHFNLGNVLKDSGNLDQAIESYRRALALQPNHAKALFNLGNALREQGKAPPAREAYLQALRIQPNWVEVLQNLAVTELELDEVEIALARFAEAHRLAPDHPDLEDLQGLACQKLGRIDQARHWYAASARHCPEDWLRTLRLEHLLEPIVPDAAWTDTVSERIQKTLDRATQAAAAIDVRTLHSSGAEPPMMLAYQHTDVRPVLDRYGDLFARHLRYEPPASKSGKPHAGIVVTRGHEGVFAACFGQIAGRLSNSDLQASIVCPSSTANVLDHLCGKGMFNYVRIPARLDEAAEAIREVNIDLLYYWEIGTDSTNYFLPFFRPTPIQVGGWGWPVTSGNQAVDIYLSAAGLEPPGAASHYRERLVMLPSLPTYYVRPQLPDRWETREAFGLDPNAHMYLCHQNLRKWHPQFDLLLEGIFQADPAGQFVFIGDKQPAITQALRARLAVTAPSAAARARVVSFLDKPRYLNLLAVADVALDTRIYGGGANTVYDAIAVGTPMVTWPALVHRGRWAAAAFERLGITALIADTAESYRSQAVRLATDAEYRQHVRAQLRERSGELFEDSQPVDEYRTFFLKEIETARNRSH